MGAWTASFLVVATMIGTGIFTTTGFLVRDVGSYPAVLLAWVIGGVTAVFGALGYAELVAAFPHNGGEYRLLTRVFGRPIGFMSAWASLVVGFAAPMAASAVAFEAYAFAAVGYDFLPPHSLAIGLVLVLSVLYGWSTTAAERFQNAFTIGKIALIVALIGAGFVFGRPSTVFSGGFAAEGGAAPGLGSALLSSKFAVGLIFVSYAYSGWNSAAYIAGEVKDPTKTLPRALFFGTGLVMLLYVGLTAAFLGATDGASLAGAGARVGHVAAVALFGEWAARALSAIIAVGLISAVGALVAAGPLIYASAGEDYPVLRHFSARPGGGGPVLSIALQSALALVMILTAQFDAILTYSGITLSVVAALTVSGVFVLRHREPDLERPYKTWGHPWSTLTFLALTAWMVIYAVVDVPMSALVGAATLVVGLLLYVFVRR
jgi:APA family basic amino acid/polyamine antiporter